MHAYVMSHASSARPADSGYSFKRRNSVHVHLSGSQAAAVVATPQLAGMSRSRATAMAATSCQALHCITADLPPGALQRPGRGQVA